jgi:hypothetical protein
VGFYCSKKHLRQRIDAPLKDDSYDSKVILMPVNKTVQIDDYNVKTIDLKEGLILFAENG